MAPSISRLFDHTVRVWRPSRASDGLGVESRNYVLRSTLGAAVNRSTAPEGLVAGGLAPTGRRRMYFLPTVDIQPRDVLEIVSGPEAPGTWEVDEPPTRPRNHHTQVDSIDWHGTL